VTEATTAPPPDLPHLQHALQYQDPHQLLQALGVDTSQEAAQGQRPPVENMQHLPWTLQFQDVHQLLSQLGIDTTAEQQSTESETEQSNY
jgi:hypothetical protein